MTDQITEGSGDAITPRDLETYAQIWEQCDYGEHSKLARECAARIEELEEALGLMIRTFGHLAGFQTNVEIASEVLNKGKPE